MKLYFTTENESLIRSFMVVKQEKAILIKESLTIAEEPNMKAY
jgi:hypothetical protein